MGAVGQVVLPAARIEGVGDSTNQRDGVTVFLLPMDHDGITVRGLDGIPGPHHLTEVFFDDVWVDGSEILGEPGNGWQVIRDALSNERVGIARYARDDRLLADVLADDEYHDALPAGRWLQARVRNRMARLMCRRALWFQRDGGSHNFIVAAARMVTTRSNLLVADALSEAVGDRFFEDRYSPEPAVNGAIEFFWRYMQAGTVAAGTTEMLQRDLSPRCSGASASGWPRRLRRCVRPSTSSSPPAAVWKWREPRYRTRACAVRCSARST